MKKALITGITGQDGSYLAEFLLEKGYEVHGIVRRASISNTARIDHLIEKNAIHLHDGDLSDSSGLIRLVGEIKPDEIYNLAAQSHVQVSFDAPEYSGDVDALGVLRVLEAVRVCGLTKTCKVYQASTSELYGKVSMFKEKPTQEVAKSYIAKGALWNGGVFAFKLGYVLNRAHELIDFVDYDDLFNKYDTLNKISFDYAVVEHEPEIEVMRFAGTWKDLGTWNTLTEAMDSHAVGEALFNEKCENVHVVNELDVPILCMGLKDVVVSASPEGILVSDKEQSSYIKPFVNTLDHRVMFAEKSWGSFKVIDIDKESMTIKVTLNAGHQMNYHSHQRRDEVWTVIAGKGKTIVDGMEQNVKAGDVITMSAGCRHTVIAETELKLIEVQLGKEIDVNDKQKFELEY